MKRIKILSSLLPLVLGGCIGSTFQSNPYLTLTETFAPTASAGSSAQGSAGTFGTASALTFRLPLNLTFRNNNPSAELNISFIAWVNLSSMRTAEQEDALLRAGYIRLIKEARLGNVFTLPIGTFIYDGGGTAGATTVFLEPNTENNQDTSSKTFSMVSPDAILAFTQPPVSCDSVAFFYTQDGEPLTSVPAAGPVGPYQGATLGGGFKTLTQVNVYQCDPFRPGLFLRVGGGVLEDNQFVEGDEITFDFLPVADAQGDFCIVTIGQPAPIITIASGVSEVTEPTETGTTTDQTEPEP